MPRPASDLPHRLIAAARDQFLQQGVDGASLRAIARSADSNIGMIYYHFGTKDGLFLAVVDDVYDQLMADLHAAIEHADGAEARLRALFHRVAEMSAEENEVMRIVFRELLAGPDRLEQLLEKFLGGHVHLIIDTLAGGVREGTLKPDHHPIAMLAATGLLGVLSQIVRRQLGDAVPAAAFPIGPELADLMLDTLLHGIATPKT